MKRLLVLFLFTLSTFCFAVDYRQLPTPEMQETYESLITELRCLVCQNQTIADSNAELADDLRRQVSEMLQQGKSKEDIVRFMTDRYGDFVLYKPPFKTKTGLLWLGPAAFLLIGLIVIFFYIRRKQSAAKTIFSAEKERKIRSLLLEKSGQNKKGDTF
ncbi:MAG: cytochrome c-type biogenesis protein CcmH [Methylococcaceae bacterium]|nr:cytochrome c-type biogenesis protein CcmH [Methylococcaceae bacterium]